MTPKQIRFCEEYLVDLNAAQAAVRSGYNYHYGHKLLKKPCVRDYLAENLSEKKSALIAKQDEMLELLTRILRRQEMESTVTTVKKKETSYDENGKKQTVETAVPQVIELPPKISDLNRAAEIFGKYCTLWTGGLNPDEDTGVIIIDNIK